MGLVLVQVGQCPQCGGSVETADGLEHHLCGRGHPGTRYVLVDTYAVDSRRSWED